MKAQKNNLLSEYYYYMDHVTELTKKYLGKFLVIKDKNIIGAYDSFEEAMAGATKKYKVGEFMVQEVGAREYLPRTRSLYLRSIDA